METRAPGLQKLLRVFVPRGACAVPREAPHHALRCARAGQCPRGTRGGRSPPFPPSLSGILRFSFFPSERRLFFCPGGGAPVRPPGGVLRDVRPGAQGRGSVGMRLAARGRPGIAGVVPGSVTGLCPSVPGRRRAAAGRRRGAGEGNAPKFGIAKTSAVWYHWYQVTNPV